MTTSDYLTEHPFDASVWPAPIFLPDEYVGGDSLRLDWEFAGLSAKEKPRIIKAWCRLLPQLSRLRRLVIWSQVTQPLFEAVCQLPHLEALQIKWSTISRLDSIQSLSALRHLHIGSSTRVESIQPLTTLSSLELLEIENFKRITDFSPLAGLKNLKSLAVVGSMWSRLRLSSLEPFAEMTSLESLAVEASATASLRPLARLQGLKELHINGGMPMEQFAWLAAQLPNARCRWFAPFLDLTGMFMGKCKRCGIDAMVMLTGRGTRVVCRHCDREAVDKHVAAFDAEKARSMRIKD